MARIDYESASTLYDRARGLATEGLDAWRTAVRPYLSEARRVVDVGAGTGQWAMSFSNWFDLLVIAVEPSRGMRLAGSRKVSGPSVRWVAGTAERLPVRSASVDVTWLSTVIHHFRDLDAAADEARRVTVSGGTALVRSAFPGRTEEISLFHFFPEAARVMQTFPSVDRTVASFETAGFRHERLEAVAQPTAPDLATFRERVSNRAADTTLRLMDDAAYERGLARLDDAISRGISDPVTDSLDLLVFRAR